MQMRVGELVQANESGGTGASKCKRGRASANEGGGATVAAAATAGPPSPSPFFIYFILVFQLVRICGSSRPIVSPPLPLVFSTTSLCHSYLVL